MTTSHLDDEALSAALDGAATEAEHVHLTSCSICQARMQSLAFVARAVATPVGDRPRGEVDAAIERALRAWSESDAAAASDSAAGAAAISPGGPPARRSDVRRRDVRRSNAYRGRKRPRRCTAHRPATAMAGRSRGHCGRRHRGGRRGGPVSRQDDSERVHHRRAGPPVLIVHEAHTRRRGSRLLRRPRRPVRPRGAGPSRVGCRRAGQCQRGGRAHIRGDDERGADGPVRRSTGSADVPGAGRDRERYRRQSCARPGGDLTVARRTGGGRGVLPARRTGRGGHAAG